MDDDDETRFEEAFFSNVFFSSSFSFSVLLLLHTMEGFDSRRISELINLLAYFFFVCDDR